MAYKTVFGKMVRVGSSAPSAPVPTAHSVAKQVKKDLKGKQGKNCNRTACQRPGAVWYNIGSLSWYCRSCAHDINTDGCLRFGEPVICFETVPKEEHNGHLVGWLGEHKMEFYYGATLGVILTPDHKLYGRQVLSKEHHSWWLVLAERASPDQLVAALEAHLHDKMLTGA